MLNQWIRIGMMAGVIGFVSVAIFVVCCFMAFLVVGLIGKIAEHFGINLDE